MQSITQRGNTVFVDYQSSAKNPLIVFFILRFSVVEQYMSKSVFRRQCKCTVTPGKTQANH